MVLAALACAAPSPAAAAPGCKGKKACKAQAGKKHPKPRTGTGWHNGIYDGGPGDPVIAPLPSLPG